MSDSYLLAVASACWLGILTSISPCPLVTNIVAMTYIGKKIDRPWYVVVTGLLYTLGRMITYVVIGVLIVASVMAIPDLSFFLQQHMHKILGPVLLLVGIFLLGAFRLNIAGPSFSQKLQGKAERYGLWGAIVVLSGFRRLIFRKSHSNCHRTSIKHPHANRVWHRYRSAGGCFCSFNSNGDALCRKSI